MAQAPNVGSGISNDAYDVVIHNGQIVDGTGNPWFYGDLAIRDKRIVKITPAGLLRDAAALESIDARGLIVAPGFIDIQSQSRVPFLTGDGRVISKVTQGITTEIIGEDWTDAPANGQVISASISAGHPISIPFDGQRSFAAWLAAIQKHGVSTNVGAFVGGSTIRSYVMGMSPSAATPAQLKVMQSLVEGAMQDGAFGVAPALAFAPARYYNSSELLALADAMRPYGGFYAFHLRSEGNQLLEGLDEVLDVGRAGHVPVEIYHFKVVGRSNWPKQEAAVARINDARAAGEDVGAFMYPYEARNGNLAACLPSWASAGGKLLENLRTPEQRERIKQELLGEVTNSEDECLLAGPQGSVVVTLRTNLHPEFSGKSLSEIADMEGKNWVDAAMDLLLAEDGRVDMLFFVTSRENLVLEMRQPWILFGTDFPGRDASVPETPSHPRGFGSYPRILGSYVRDEHVLPLEDAIRKMTSSPAARLSLHDRGRLEEGMYADVVIFDPRTVADRATYARPNEISVGIRYVFVNGEAVVRDEKHTGAKPGRIVYGPGRQSPAHP